MDGLEPPGIEIPEMWNCEVEPSATEQGKQYTFIGDVEAVIKRVFHEDAEVVGATRMTVPYDAVRANSSLIDINHPGITMSHDRLRSRRNLAQRTGAQRLLIVRAIDKDGISPNHWKQHLRDDFFQDGNNLVRFFITIFFFIIKCFCIINIINIDSFSFLSFRKQECQNVPMAY